MKKVLILLFSLLLAAWSARAETEKSTDKYKDIDSTLLGYYRWCNKHVRDSVVLLKADTLFRLAGEQRNTRMQSVALCLKADHYYFTEQLDSLKAWIPRVQAFTRIHNELTHYYFCWSRLILYYTKHNRFTLAQYELEHYLAQAEKDDYKPAMAEAYKQLGHIYRTRSLAAQAAESYRKAIDYIEENDLDRFSLSLLYGEMSLMLIELKRYPEAEEAIRKGIESIPLPEYIWSLKLKQVLLYLRTDRLAEARTLYDEIQRENKGRIRQEHLLDMRLQVEMEENHFRDALATVDTLIELYEKQGYDHYFYLTFFSKLGWIHYNLGNYKEAYENLDYYVKLYHQKVSSDQANTLSEFATLLDVNRLDQEKAEAERLAQDERYRRTRLMLFGLLLILALCTGFILLLTRMNRNLARAKHAAEQTSRMKGLFIRNITHEINTPLNAIVGFARLAATGQADEAERQDYINIIQQNSAALQKIIDDVLYIADIESSEGAPEIAPTDLNDCCRHCLDRIAESVAPGTAVRFLPDGEHCTIPSSRLLLSKALTELLRNAVRFAPDGIVTLAYTLGEGSVTFTVTDTGPGVPAAEAERIFERFVKLDTFSQGMGLGLSVARLIARTLGGELRLDTFYAPGARFVMEIPYHRRNPGEGGVGNSRKMRGMAGRRTALLGRRPRQLIPGRGPQAKKRRPPLLFAEKVVYLHSLMGTIKIPFT